MKKRREEVKAQDVGDMWGGAVEKTVDKALKPPRGAAANKVALEEIKRRLEECVTRDEYDKTVDEV